MGYDSKDSEEAAATAATAAKPVDPALVHSDEVQHAFAEGAKSILTNEPLPEEVVTKASQDVSVSDALGAGAAQAADLKKE